jgi:hypothetical protein
MFTRHVLSSTTTAYHTDLSHREAAQALQHEPRFRGSLTQAIAAHEAVFWECAPSDRATTHTPFHFVVVDSLAVSRLQPSSHAFRQFLRDPAVSFWNLSGDALLVVPGGAVPAHSAHIAEWCRHAPEAERDGLWSQVGAAMEAWWAETAAPVWVSTSGLGVSWVHVRLDKRPKYISHPPFRQSPA